MKKLFFSTLLLFVLTGCQNEGSSKIDVNLDLVNNTIPYGYQIYNIYYENLDDDVLKESIVIYEESPTFQKNQDFLDWPKTLPIKIAIFDYRFGKWDHSPLISTESLYLETPYFLSEPYKIIETSYGVRLVVYSYNGGYDGLVHKISVFEYNGKSNLVSHYIDPTIFATNGVIDKGERIYLLACSPFWDPINGGNEIVSYRVDLTTEYATADKYSISEIDCPTFLKELEQYDYGYRGEGVELILEKYGVKFN